VEADPAAEIRHYVQEQTVSVSYHRCGNVGLADTNPLVHGQLLHHGPVRPRARLPVDSR
jgi:hypothetical protein